LCPFISQSGATPGWLKRAGPTKTPRESFARYPGKLCPYLSLISITIPNQSQKHPQSLSLSLSTTCTEVWKHKLTGEEVKKVTNYICGKLRMIEIGRIERDIWIWFLEKE
jgi:hypothetical protein